MEHRCHKRFEKMFVIHNKDTFFPLSISKSKTGKNSCTYLLNSVGILAWLCLLQRLLTIFKANKVQYTICMWFHTAFQHDIDTLHI